MAGVDIQAKVKKGLARAIVKTSSASADLVYKIGRTSNGGTPMNPIAPTETEILLVDAIFKSYHDTQIDQTLILSGDRQLVTNGDVLIEPNDIIQIGIERFIVQPSVDVKNPAGVPLAYIAQVRPTGNYIAPPIASSVVTLEDAEAITGTPDSVAYYDSGGTLAGSMIPDLYIEGDLVNGLYTYLDGGSGEYVAAMFSDSGFSKTGDIIVSIAGRSDTYVRDGGGYINRSVAPDLFDYMKGLESTPSAILIYDA